MEWDFQAGLPKKLRDVCLPAIFDGAQMSMDAESIFAALDYPGEGGFPRCALEEIMDRREEMVPHLLGILQQARVSPEAFETGPRVMLPTYAAYLLAAFGETRAYRPLIDVLSLEGHRASDLFGDSLTEDMYRLIAAVYDGDLSPIEALIENPQLNEYVRDCGISAYAALHLWGVVSRERLEAYFIELYDHRLEREPSYVWESLIGYSADFGMKDLLPRMRQAHEEGLSDLLESEWAYFEELMQQGAPREAFMRLHAPIEDVLAHMEGWYCFEEDAYRDVEGLDDEDMDFIPDPRIWSTPGVPMIAEPKIGRNEPCPCASGLKFKKCCGKD